MTKPPIREDTTALDLIDDDDAEDRAGRRRGQRVRWLRARRRRTTRA